MNAPRTWKQLVKAKEKHWIPNQENDPVNQFVVVFDLCLVIPALMPSCIAIYPSLRQTCYEKGNCEVFIPSTLVLTWDEIRVQDW